jgi:hypothetical protein
LVLRRFYFGECNKVMNRSRPAGFLLLLAVSSLAAAATRPEIGEVTRVQGQASASFGGETRVLAAGDAIYFRDLLSTGRAARLSVRLDDGSTLRLGENARLSADSFVFPPERGLSRLRIQVPLGAFLFQGGEVEDAPRAKVEIRAPVATLGIRGTQVWGGRLLDGDYGVLVVDGEVEVRNSAGMVGLGPREGTRIKGVDTPPAAAKVWAEPLVREAFGTVAFPGE